MCLGEATAYAIGIELNDASILHEAAGEIADKINEVVSQRAPEARAGDASPCLLMFGAGLSLT